MAVINEGFQIGTKSLQRSSVGFAPWSAQLQARQKLLFRGGLVSVPCDAWRSSLKLSPTKLITTA